MCHAPCGQCSLRHREIASRVPASETYQPRSGEPVFQQVCSYVRRCRLDLRRRVVLRAGGRGGARELGPAARAARVRVRLVVRGDRAHAAEGRAARRRRRRLGLDVGGGRVGRGVVDGARGRLDDDGDLFRERALERRCGCRFDEGEGQEDVDGRACDEGRSRERSARLSKRV